MDQLNLVNAMVQDSAADVAADYKALVCIFMSGGTDANNMVRPNRCARCYITVARRRAAVAVVGNDHVVGVRAARHEDAKPALYSPLRHPAVILDHRIDQIELVHAGSNAAPVKPQPRMFG